MKMQWLGRLGMVLALALAACLAGSPATAQQTDLNAINERISKFSAAGNYAAALVEARKLEAAVKARFGANHPNYAVALNNLANVYQRQGKYAEAAVLYERALAIREKALGASHPDVARSLNNLASVYNAQGKYAEAEGLHQRVLAIREKTLGPSHPDVADSLNNLANVYLSQGKYAEAAELYQRALAIKEKALGPSHPDVAISLNNLAAVYDSQGKYAEAIDLHKRALAIKEKALGPSHPDVAATLDGLAIVYASQGQYAEAAELRQRALAIWEKALGPDHPDVAPTLNGLAIVYASQGQYAEAAQLFQRSLAIDEKALGPSHPNVARTLNNLANVYKAQGKYAEAAGLYQRALAIKEKALGPNHPDVARTLNNLAHVYKEQGKYAEAGGLLQRALAIEEKALGPSHRDVGTTLSNLGIVYNVQGKYAEAAEFHQRALAVQEKALGPSHPDVAQTLHALASLYQDQGKYAEAAVLYERALAIREKALGPSHPALAQTLNNLADMYRSAGKPDLAPAYSRKATAAVIAHALTGDIGGQRSNTAGGLIEQRADYFVRHVANLAAAAGAGLGPMPALGHEGFEIAQWAVQSSAGAAVQQMALRFASGNNVLAALVRDNQDLAAAWRGQDKALIAALAKPEGQQDRAATDALRAAMAETEGKLAANATRLEKEFPDYAALANPKPLSIEEAQKLLGADEALVFILPGDKESYVFALTAKAFDWKTTPFGKAALSDKVAAFRKGLDVYKLESFDLNLAQELYAALLGPVEALIKDKRHLLVAASGSLTALPFHLLVTEKPADAAPDRDRGAVYRDAAWLVKRHAISVLPTVTSLKALRLFGRKDQGAKPMIGFGDPVFDPDQAPAPDAAAKQRGAANSRVKSASRATRAYSDVWSGAGVDRKALADAPRLPDTADELKAVRLNLGAPASDIHLGRDASETTVKRAPLADYRVVYFATHALVAGDVKGLGEPSLLLSVPRQPTEIDDGLLTASEVAQLKLNADWVVLAACNTDAGDKKGAEALSGLARAFFYAGARALLVSHWEVNSDAAAKLNISTFDILKADPSLGRAEAVRRAMLAYMNDASKPTNVYPALWGAFSVVGEGAGK